MRSSARFVRTGQASIGSFARFTLDLLAFGAPAELIEAAQRAALDEVRHARLCFGLAARYGAGERGPGPLPAADARVAASLWDACLAAFEEGCVGETLAALQARSACDLAADPEVRAALDRIASEEAAHAALAWRFVTWAASQLGLELPRALADCLRPVAPERETEASETIAALHAAGRLTVAGRQPVAFEGLRDVVIPCLARLAALPRPAAESAPAPHPLATT